jgi:hypothetical protein
MALLSMRAYARYRKERGLPGSTADAVSEAVRTGRITCKRTESGDGQIDPVVADREWLEHTEPGRWSQEVAADPDQGPELEEGSGYDEAPAIDEDNPKTVTQAKVTREKYLSKMAKLEYEERVGSLVPAADVEKEWIEVGSIVKTKVLGLAAKLKQRCPDLTTEQFAALELISREALEELSGE